MNENIDEEVRACLALAEAFDGMDLTFPPCLNYEDGNGEKGKRKRKETAVDYVEQVKARIVILSDLIDGKPLSKHDKHNGYAREHLIYLLGCQLYSLTKKIHKESFFSKDQQGLAEPCGGSLTK